MADDDKFEERMIKSNRDRRREGAKMALKRLQSGVEDALKAMDRGLDPNIDLIHYAAIAQQHLAELRGIDEIVEIFKETRGVPASE